jgi:hypothetical protein
MRAALIAAMLCLSSCGASVDLVLSGEMQHSNPIVVSATVDGVEVIAPVEIVAGQEIRSEGALMIGRQSVVSVTANGFVSSYEKTPTASDITIHIK